MKTAPSRLAAGEVAGFVTNLAHRDDSVPTFDELAISEEELGNARLTPTCFVEAYLYADVAVMAAPGGTGKTTVLLHEAVCLALGRPIWGLDVHKPGWTLFVTAEDQRERLVARLRRVIEAMELTADESVTVLAAVRVWDVTGEARKLVTVRDGNVEPTALADQIVERYRDNPPAVVIFDPLVSFGADEERVNTNEQAIITACRRIVRGLDCCVRLVAHTGQAVAREGTLDQYASRGGSALSDGARMVVVLQPCREESKLRPPQTLRPDPDSSLIVMARPKLSHTPPNLPHIWIKRTGFTYEYAIDQPTDPEKRANAQADQLERFLASELKLQRRYTRNTLQDARKKLDMSRDEVRAAITELEAAGRVSSAELPSHLRQGGRKHYLRPTYLADDAREVPPEAAA